MLQEVLPVTGHGGAAALRPDRHVAIDTAGSDNQWIGLTGLSAAHAREFRHQVAEKRMALQNDVSAGLLDGLVELHQRILIKLALRHVCVPEAPLRTTP